MECERGDPREHPHFTDEEVSFLSCAGRVFNYSRLPRHGPLSSLTSWKMVVKNGNSGGGKPFHRKRPQWNQALPCTCFFFTKTVSIVYQSSTYGKEWMYFPTFFSSNHLANLRRYSWWKKKTNYWWVKFM